MQSLVVTLPICVHARSFVDSLPRRFCRCVMPVVLLAVIFTGCSPSEVLEDPASGQTLYGATTRIRGFDPVKAGDVASGRAIGKVYEGLLQYHYLKRPYELVPLLAESMPEVSEDGLTYTFRIRPGIYFMDDPCFTETGGEGRELVAEDFVYSIKRVADLNNASTGYWAFNDRIAGLDAFRETTSEGPTDYDRPVEGLQATDRYTLQLTLTRPYPQFLYILAMHYAFAVPREAVEYYGADFLNHPVGTGAFALKDWQRNYRVEFMRNPAWEKHGRIDRYPDIGAPGDREAGLLEPAGEPLPFLDGIVEYVVGDSQTQWLMFLSGQFDRFGGISRDNWDAVITPDRSLDPELAAKGIRLWAEPTIDIFYIGFNMDDPLLRDHPGLRQALSAAFDRESWVQFFNDRIMKATAPVPPGLAGHISEPHPYGYDLELAKQRLAEAGFPDGIDPETGRRLELTIDIGSADSAEAIQSTELVVDFMRRIGIDLKPQYNHWPAFLEKISRRQIQLYRLGWIADYPDAENFLQLFYGPNRSPGPNHSAYSNPEFDALYEKARVMQDSPERTALYEEMSEMVRRDCPWILTHYRLSYSLTYEWLEHFKYHDFPYLNTKYLKINETLRTQGGGL